MYVLKITIAATATAQPIIPSAVQPASSHQVQGAIFQNNGSNTMYIGDSKVTTTNCIQLLATGSLSGFPPVIPNLDLNEFYVIGTLNDVLDIMVFP